jgi:hypothetical protein
LASREFIKELYSLHEKNGDGTMSTIDLKKMVASQKVFGKSGEQDSPNSKRDQAIWVEVESYLNIKGQKTIIFDKFFELIFKAAQYGE